jgi:ABC-type phosphate transport system auxiliary subunit
LIRADSRDARLWAEAIAAVEGARDAHAANPTEATKVALAEAEARIDERTIILIGSGLERDEIRTDLDHASSDLAAAAQDRISAERDRIRARGDRSAAELDRQASAADRQQSALDRASDPYLSDEDL